MDEGASIMINVWVVGLEKGSSHCNFDYVICLSTLSDGGDVQSSYCLCTFPNASNRLEQCGPITDDVLKQV